jgi:quinol monooxygenase YgiN
MLTLPPHRADEMFAALRTVILPARLERGCGRAQILRDVDAPEVVSYIEEWPRQEDLEKRIRSAPFGHLLELMEACPSPPTIEFRVVTEVRGLEYVAAVRQDGPAQP